jgi:pimeloyl-ACP methyl ester carboxylesterase
LACRVLGTGLPVTLVAHAWGSCSRDMLPMSAALLGTRVLIDFRGHGESSRDSDVWTYAQQENDLAAVADAFDATRLLGQSMGAGAALRLVAGSPKFDRVAIVTPPPLDGPLSKGARMLLERVSQALAAQDRERLLPAIDACLGSQRAEDGADDRYARLYSESLLVRRPPLQLADDVIGLDATVLRKVRVATLVIGQEGDPIHDVSSAVTIASLVAGSRLVVFDETVGLWRRGPELRLAVAEFLNGN